ncbi:MAG TPA: guanylate kinase [Paludibacter sp.]|nr:guanylate kinase [Paludibacter sp.]
MSGKLIIFSAPSGAGKSTLVQYLLGCGFDMEFSVSATSRAPRGTEKHGVDYYYLTPEEFRQKIDNQEFLEYEEVYSNCYYGTLRSEVERITGKGKNIVFDVDVVGGLNIKKEFGDRALALFIAPPSVDELHKRLVGRGTDTPEMIEKRIGKAEYEMTFAPRFDTIVVNDNLEVAKAEAERSIRKFLNK